MSNTTYQDRFSIVLHPYPMQTWFHNEIKQKNSRLHFHKKITAKLPRPRLLFREAVGLGPRKPNEPLEIDSKHVRFSHIKVITLWTGHPPDIIVNRPEYKLIASLKDNHWLVFASVENVTAWVDFTEKQGCVANYIPRVIVCPIWHFKEPELDANGVEVTYDRKETSQINYAEIKAFVARGYSDKNIVPRFPNMVENTIRYNIRKAKKELEKEEENGETSTKHTIRVI